jgi:MoxR-like ATPase
VAAMFTGARYFEAILFSFTPPEEIYGPVSMKGLDQDRFERATTGYLPQADIAFVDEIFKGGEGVLNGFLAPINERIYKNGTQVQPMPLRLFASASNEVPPEGSDLAALWDRLFIRCQVPYLGDSASWLALVQGNQAPTTMPAPLTLPELDQIQAEVRSMPVQPDTWDALLTVKKNLESAGIYISDRKWRQVGGDRSPITGQQEASLMKAAAWLNGRDRVQPTDLTCLYNACWNWPDDEVKARTTIGRVVNPLDAEAQQYLNEAQEVFAQLAAIQHPPESNEYTTALAGINRQLLPISRKVQAQITGRDRTDPANRTLFAAADAVKRMNGVIADKLQGKA